LCAKNLNIGFVIEKIMKTDMEEGRLLKKKISRRAAISRAVAIGSIVGVGIIAGLGGYYAGTLGAPAKVETVTKTETVTVGAATVTETKTVRETVTVPGTATAPAPTLPPGLGPEDEPYLRAADEFIAWIGEDTVLTPEQLKQEVYHFVAASKPYRGTTLINMYEALPGAVWEEQYLGEWFERITGIKVAWEAMSNYETILKSFEDAKTRAGIYDVLGTDQDMHGFYVLNKSALNLSEFMREHPELVPPYLDVDDIWAKGTYSYKGDIYAIHGQAPWIDSMVRTSWFKDPKNREDFKKKYGYDLKTPLEYYLDARRYVSKRTTTSVEDDWTISKCEDVIEFFTRPDEKMWGSLGCLRPGDHLGWLGDWLDDAFQFCSPAPLGSYPAEVATLDPIITPFGCNTEGGALWGTSQAEGGTLDTDAGAKMYDFWLHYIPEHSPPKAREIDAVESWTAWGIDGTYAFHVMPHHFFPVFVGPESKVVGDFEVGPLPVYEPWYHPLKPRGYVDPSGYIISAYSKNKEAAFLFITFLNSKAVDLKKNMEIGMTMRISTMKDPRYRALDDKFGKFLTVFDVTGKYLYGTDAKWVIYPQAMSVARDAALKALEEKLDGAETAKLVASEIDKWIKENGWYGKKVLE